MPILLLLCKRAFPPQERFLTGCEPEALRFGNGAETSVDGFTLLLPYYGHCTSEFVFPWPTARLSMILRPSRPATPWFPSTGNSPATPLRRSRRSAGCRQMSAISPDWSFLFESVVGGERIGRYSFLGAGPFLTFEAFDRNVTVRGTVKPQEWHPIRPAELAGRTIARFAHHRFPVLPRFCGGAVGTRATTPSATSKRCRTPRRTTAGSPT